MKIVVLVKYVPDAAAPRGFAPDHTTDRAASPGLLSELDEYAVEAALKLTESAGGEVTALTMGPADAETAVKKALQMGADAGVHIVDDGLHGSDAVATSLVLAKALGTIEHDLVLCGMASTDGTMSVVPAMLAERLGVPQVTLVSELAVDGGTVRGRRDAEDATLQIEAALPAIVSVTDQINEPRYPSFKGIMAAKKKPVQTLTLADLGVDGGEVGLGAARTQVTDVTQRPPRTKGTIVKDEGDGAAQLVQYLATEKFV